MTSAGTDKQVVQT